MANLGNTRSNGFSVVRITVSPEKIVLTSPAWTQARVRENPSPEHVAALKRVLEGAMFRQYLGGGKVTGQMRVANADMVA